MVLLYNIFAFHETSFRKKLCTINDNWRFFAFRRGLIYQTFVHHKVQ